jgi:phenylalanyl-tRNA synthetase beta chain
VDVYPQPIENFKIALNIDRVHRLIGQYIGVERIKSILTDLNILIEGESESHLQLSVPPHKVDVKREADVVEEILRIYGFNHVELKPNLSASFLAQFPHPDPEVLKSTVANQLSSQGFHEIMTNSLTDSKYYENSTENRDESLVRILNYNSEDLDVMRKTLVYSGLETLRRNINRKQKDLQLYEFGKIYWQENGKYKEQNQLVLFATGNTAAETWRQPSAKTSFYELAETVQHLLVKLNARNFSTRPTEHAYLSDGITYLKNDVTVAHIGLVNAAVAKQADVKEPVWYAELNWEYLTRNYKDNAVFEELPKFPEVRRDLSLVLDKTVSFEQVKQIVERTERKLLQDINVFDVYEGDKIEAGKKAIAISFTLQDKNQTLTDKVIDSTMNRLMQQFEHQLGAVIRK